MTTTFRLDGELPRGLTAIQASAGTGKTFTLASLVTRYLAEGRTRADGLLVVTFTRAATAELRSRVRERLVQAAAHLHAPTPTDDALLALLASADRDARRARLERAVAELDAATITTIHGFATQVLGTLGAAAAVDPDRVLEDDVAVLAPEICADVLAAAATRGHPPTLLPKPPALLEVTRLALANPGLLLLPTPDDEGADPAHLLLRDLVAEVLGRIEEHRRRAGTRGYADILTDLRDALTGPTRAVAAAVLRGRYQVALIDEFQDTDPVQWEIFRTLFPADDDGALVLVGDPKQAIYGFRGADVSTYVAAARSGGEPATLGTNWRSDGALLDALDTALAGATFGGPAIGFLPVAPAPGHEDRRLLSSAGDPLPALHLRLAVGPDIAQTTKGQPSVEGATDAIVRDLAAQVRNLLDDARVPVDRDGERGGRPTRPSDIAVLVTKADEAAAVEAELKEQGVPAVLARGGSVLDSPAADQWRWLLSGLARPSDVGRARAVALSWFGGRTAEWLAAASDDDLIEVQEQLQRWNDVLAADGVDAFIRRVWSDSGVVARVAARRDGDRALTDLEHVGELLRAATPSDRSSVDGLVLALATDPDPAPEVEMLGDLASRRIETEDDAVQIMTVWVAKGLEFPIVCCPTLWRKRRGTALYADPDHGRRAHDLAGGKGWPDKATASVRKRTIEQEDEGEALRLLYVALTRAAHQMLVWWAPCAGSETSPLARVLFGRDGSGAIDPEAFGAAKVPVPDPQDAAAQVRSWSAAAGDAIAVGTHGAPERPAARWQPPGATTPTGPLTVADLPVTPSRLRRRWSFTAITRHAAEVDHDVDDPTVSAPGGGDEQSSGAAEPDPDAQPPAVDGSEVPPPDELFPSADGTAQGSLTDPTVSPLSSLPAGAAFGILAHEVLEQVDFADASVDTGIAAEVDRQMSWRSLDLTPVGLAEATPTQGRDLLVAGLRAALDTPLGPAFDGRRLRDLRRGDRLDEVSFELRLADAGPAASDRELGRTVLDHLPADDPFRPWATDLAGGAFDVDLAGHLTGSIDLVARVGGAESPRFVVVDYKTNRLHDRGAAPGPDSYGPEAMAEAMAHAHYPLQALLYAVALHRYLRWRLPGYQPSRHLGGIAYLFLRGMSGAAVPTTDGAPHGVCTWTPPGALVVALSDLLDGRRVPGR